MRFARTHHMPVVSVLPALTLGPDDRGPTAGGQMVLDFLRGRVSAIVPGGVTVVDARDVAATLEAAARKGRAGERYLAAGSFVSFAELLRLLERVSGVPAPTRRMPRTPALWMAGLQELRFRLGGRPPSVTRVRLRALFAEHVWDASKARRELGVSFRQLEETLRDTVASWFGSTAWTGQPS
jgi:dihydroflavonol-4-reductase